MGPTIRVSFSEIPEEDLAEASKTALTLVVLLDSFLTTCIGRYIGWFFEVFCRNQLSVLHLKIIYYSSITEWNSLSTIF